MIASSVSAAAPASGVAPSLTLCHHHLLLLLLSECCVQIAHLPLLPTDTLLERRDDSGVVFGELLRLFLQNDPLLLFCLEEFLREN